MRSALSLVLIATGCITIAVSNAPNCTAGAEAKSAMSSQQGTINALTGLLDKTVDTVKKSAESLSRACQK